MAGLKMPGESAARSEQRLTIQSRIEDLGLVWPWVESLAAQHALPDDTCFAIDLCLEEAVSNVIRHGYRGQPDQPITIDFAIEPGKLAFAIEDQASPFDPLAQPVPEKILAPASVDEIPLGGRGILLMRKFADSLAYERLPGGNRLTIWFPVPR